MVIDVVSPDNVTLGLPSLNILGDVVFILHQVMKFSIKYMIGKFFSNQSIYSEVDTLLLPEDFETKPKERIKKSQQEALTLLELIESPMFRDETKDL